MAGKIGALSTTVLLVARSFCQLTPVPSFDVASVRPAQPIEGRGFAALRETISSVPGTLTMRNVTLSSAIRWAYSLKPFELSGPDWLNDKRFDIVAKAADAKTEDEHRVMLRALLGERFKLAVHRQSKEASALVLLTGKGAAKLEAVEGSDEGTMTGVALSFEGHKMTMLRLANILSSALKIPVIDRTGLNGHYDFKLDMRPYMTRQPGDPPLDLMGVAVAAVQEQLGLRLESQKANISVLVVDHAEKTPSEN